MHFPLQVEIEPVFPTVRRLLSGARAASVPVVHCVAGRSSVPTAPPNYPLAAALARRRASAAGDTPADPGLADQGEEIEPAIGPEPADIRVVRGHGLTPFTGTELDSVLRLLGVRTVVASGVSLNMGIIGMTLEAVGLGYRVAVVTDAVAGRHVTTVKRSCRIRFDWPRRSSPATNCSRLVLIRPASAAAPVVESGVVAGSPDRRTPPRVAVLVDPDVRGSSPGWTHLTELGVVDRDGILAPASRRW